MITLTAFSSIRGSMFLLLIVSLLAFGNDARALRPASGPAVDDPVSVLRVAQSSNHSLQALISAFRATGSALGLNDAGGGAHLFYDSRTPILFRLGPTPMGNPALLPQSGRLEERLNEDNRMVFEMTFFKNAEVWIEGVAVLEERQFQDAQQVGDLRARFQQIARELNRQLSGKR
ncbi:MAG: hypothetical protein V2J10_06035 [Wenzhouxiangella sp.]|nr:hypothetical protein [Wenzhouxiangella sp.]